MNDPARNEERAPHTPAGTDTDEMIRAAFDHAPIGIWNVDRSGRLVSVNHRMAALLGYEVHELIGRRFITLCLPEDTEAALDRFERLFDGTLGASRIDRRYVRKDGTTLWCNTSFAPIHDDGGRVTHVVSMVEDITARRAAEEALKMREAQLQEAQSIARIGSYIYEPVTGIRDWSAEGLRIFGGEVGVPASVVLRAVHPDDSERAVSEFETALRERRPFASEFRIVVDGETRDILSLGRIDESAGVLRVIGTVQDVTAQRSLERELRRRADQQEALTALGQLALTGVPLSELFDAVAESLCHILEADFCEVFRREEGHLRLVAGRGFEAGEIGTATVYEGIHSQAGYTLAVALPIVLENVDEEVRFSQSGLLARHGVRSGMTVLIATMPSRPWGVLGAHFLQPRTYSEHDVTFMRAVASIAAQAVERTSVEEQLRARVAQQSAVAELGQCALSHIDHATFRYAAALIATGLAVDEAEYIADGSASSSQALPDGATRITVPVAGPSGPLGVLTATSYRPRQFGPIDINFMQSMAHILSEGVAREQTLAALTASEERYRDVVEGASEVIFTLAPDGTVTSLNRAFGAITGAEASAYLGQSFLRLVHPDDVRRIRRVFRGVLSSKQPVKVESRMLGRGRVLTFAFSTFPRIENGVVVAVHGFGRDVTEERFAQQERDRLTRDLQLLLESTAEGIYTVDTAGRCTMINGAAATLLGRSREELLGADMHALVHQGAADPAGSDACEIVRVARTGEIVSAAETTFWRRDGMPLPVEFSAAPIIDRGQVKGVVVTFTDLSERRQLESRLEQAHRIASLGKLAATVAHEFNNVLMGIAPFLDILRRHPSGDRADTAIDQISRSVKRGKRITEDILRFTQPAEPLLTSVDVTEWLRNVALEARSLLASRYAVDVIVSDPTLTIEADANQLNQTLMNLIINARDAMPGGGTVIVRASVPEPGTRYPFGIVEHPERFVHVTVEDSGVGIDETTMRHIFEPLFTTKKNGTGIGLAVAHHVIRRHHGEIHVESRVGSGTTFHVFLPRTGAPAFAENVPAPTASSPRVTRVLLVEDERAVSAGLIALLGLEGVSVELVETGAEVLDAIARFDPEAVILDIGLPDMDGAKVYRLIAARYPSLPVIFSTGHGDQSKLDEHLTKPHVRFLLKPYEVETLLETLAMVVASPES